MGKTELDQSKDIGQALEDFLEKDRMISFDLGQPPLMRFTLVCCSKTSLLLDVDESSFTIRWLEYFITTRFGHADRLSCT